MSVLLYENTSAIIWIFVKKVVWNYRCFLAIIALLTIFDCLLMIITTTAADAAWIKNLENGPDHICEQYKLSGLRITQDKT